jgi:hypothetical protein
LLLIKFAIDNRIILTIHPPVNRVRVRDTPIRFCVTIDGCDLDFVPLFEEGYDLEIPQEQVDSLGSPAFRVRVGELVRHEPSLMGEMVVV